jgi:hypothetical protein
LKALGPVEGLKQLDDLQTLPTHSCAQAFKRVLKAFKGFSRPLEALKRPVKGKPFNHFEKACEDI